jgi:GNAT superfamily N-acetyltransferase
MPPPFQIKPIADLPGDFERLRVEGAQEGFGFLERLSREWRSGHNRFSHAGEQLLGGFAENRLVAIGGINRDPYVEGTSTGRLRHLYVLKDWRFGGVGRGLVDQLLGHAKGVFSQVRLRTGTDEASAFYLRCGFTAVRHETASHVKVI